MSEWISKWLKLWYMIGKYGVSEINGNELDNMERFINQDMWRILVLIKGIIRWHNKQLSESN